MRILKSHISTIILLINSIVLYPQSINLPTYPVDPVFPKSDTEKKPSIKTSDNNESPTVIRAEITATLGTDDELKGTIEVPENISFQHYREGLVYQKTISPEEIKSIMILKYSRREGGSSKGRIFYQYEPSLIEIKLKDGSSFQIGKIFSFLKSFSIETQNGRTRLFTVFGDTFDKATGWLNVDSKDIHYHDIKPHPASVKKIVFRNIERES